MTSTNERNSVKVDNVGVLTELYKQLHSRPELAFNEHATARVSADALSDSGFEVSVGIGGTGVVGVLRNGQGPNIMLRADMDALPIAEQTGLEYASRVTAVDGDGRTVPVSHACGHDLHVVCLIGACHWFASNRDAWSGTLVALFQPGEESGRGARRVVEDGLFERFPVPEVVLGQHVGPGPVGTIGTCEGPVMAATDGIRIRLHGRGGHGSKPEAAIDPVLMACHLVTRLQGIVSRETPPSECVVVSVGAIRAGEMGAAIPDEAILDLNVRTRSTSVRDKVLASIARMAEAETLASGSTTPPSISTLYSNPMMVNDAEATDRVARAHRVEFGIDRVISIPPVTASEDFGILATESGARSTYWFIGGVDPALYMAALARGTLDEEIPQNHASDFAPVPGPTIEVGVRALISAALAWLS